MGGLPGSLDTALNCHWVRRVGCFNPLSPRRTRDTCSPPRCDRFDVVQCFNPLSPRRTRDTGITTNQPGSLSCFNPLSPRRTRDTICGGDSVTLPGVSIRSRPEGREIPIGLDATGFTGNLVKRFQSALAPKDERYRWDLVSDAVGLHGVSIRSRPEGREILP